MKFAKILILDIEIANVTKEDVLTVISKVIKSSQKAMMFFVNAHNLIEAYHNNQYRNILKQTDYVYGDGIGVHLAGRLTNQEVKDNVNGTDLFPFLCQLCEREKYSIYFLGSKPGIVNKMIQNLKEKYPLLMVAGAHHGYFGRKNKDEEIIRNINNSKTDILLVGLGTPLQEEWIYDNFQSINCNVVMGVGGLFDFYSGSKLRAPLCVRKLGFEWFFRLVQEPGRLWKRYIIGIPQFIYIVVKQKIQKLRK